MSDTDKIKDDNDKDYLHPEGKPVTAATTSEEKENKEKAKASTQLVKEIAEAEKCDKDKS